MSIEGPRSLRTGEMPALCELEEKVFRPGMPAEYPQVFHEGNSENLTVCFDGSRCVSHTGMVVRGASIYGCRIETGLIGGVATDPDYRGQGLAGLCVDHAFERAERIGVDILLISGARDLYLRRDCVRAGLDAAFVLPAEEVAALDLNGPALSPVVLSEIDEKDLSLIRESYRMEPVRFLRRAEDYTQLYRCRTVLDRFSDFFAIRTPDGAFRGYIIAPSRVGSNGSLTIAEIGGDRRTVLAALPQLLKRHEGVQSLSLHVSGSDRLTQSLLVSAGYVARPAPMMGGTVRIASFVQFMERLRPLFEESAGFERTAALSFAAEGDTCIFRYRSGTGIDTLHVGRGDAARLIFGTPDRAEEKLLARAGEGLAGVLREILPVPALRYGLSYV